jgi:DNA-binding CsgD family transcriptional regulator
VSVSQRVTAAILAPPVAGEGQGGERVAIVAERRLTVAALTALLLRDAAYRVVHEARGLTEVNEMLAAYEPAVIVEARTDSPGTANFPATTLLVNPDDRPDGFASAVRTAIDQARNSRFLPHAQLSDRERDILVRIASGRSTKEIARDCAITPKTVGNHVSNICHKFDLHHRGQLVLFALQQGLTTA